MNPRTPALVIVLLIVCIGPRPVTAADPEFLWPAPETNALGGALFSGYSFGDPTRGAMLGARMLFFFRYFVAGLSGDMKFAPDGTTYAMTLDMTGRYGPLQVGFLFGLHWFPGQGGDPSTGIGALAGLHIPTGLDGLWFDLSYRPNLVFMEGAHLSYHAINLGLIIEAGL